jgi:hypothetical protein
MALNAITCPACGIEEPCDADGNAPPALHTIGLFTCDACGARVVYGTLLPHVAVEWFTDANGFKWLRKRYQHPRTREDQHVIDLDPHLAALEARDVLVMVIR